MRILTLGFVPQFLRPCLQISFVFEIRLFLSVWYSQLFDNRVNKDFSGQGQSQQALKSFCRCSRCLQVRLCLVFGFFRQKQVYKNQSNSVEWCVLQTLLSRLCQCSAHRWEFRLWFSSGASQPRSDTVYFFQALLAPGFLFFWLLKLCILHQHLKPN